MTDPEPVLVLDEEVPDGPVDGRGGEAVHLALQHHVVTQRLHHAGAHGTDFRPEPYSSIIINTCCLFKKPFPHLTMRLAVMLTAGPTLLLASHTYSPRSVLSTLLNLEMGDI